jgi:limonene-1,2-epoxide hydrolase
MSYQPQGCQEGKSVGDNGSVIRDFCKTINTRDVQALRSYFAVDAVYQNAGMPASVGVEAIMNDLAGQFAAFPDSYEYRLVNLAADGDVVLTERLDMISGPDEPSCWWTAGLPVGRTTGTPHCRPR